ncbi:MAG TPA: hypothetical protein VEO74_00620 [Thermoanaerobaculia bacterium]|nr:hypothetical protein [Thermoanaerobaculia bacterium]
MIGRLSAVILLLAAPLLAQQQPPVADAPPHDIEMVEPAPLGGAIAVPLPEAQRRRLKKYEIPELAGARQALGSQLIDGALPRPLIDFVSADAKIRERISFFEGGLVVIDVAGAGATIRKRVLVPADALHNYTTAITAARLSSVRVDALVPPRDGRRAALRVYDAPGHFVERQFDPMATLPKRLADQVLPMQGLLRAIYQDRTVTNSVANYAPKEGDELVGDDSRVWRVKRVISDKIVVLECANQPLTMYVDVHDLYNYFIGKPKAASR